MTKMLSATADRVRALHDRLENDVGVVAGGLIGRRTVVAPNAGLVAVGEDLGLGTDLGGWLFAVDPEVFGPIGHCNSPACIRGDGRSAPYRIIDTRSTVNTDSGRDATLRLPSHNLRGIAFRVRCSHVNGVLTGRANLTNENQSPHWTDGTPAGVRTAHSRGARRPPDPLWFTDVLGMLKSVAISPAELESAFEEGLQFDGSAIDGFSRVQESDVLAAPDAAASSCCHGPTKRADGPHLLRHPQPRRHAVRW